VHVVRAADPHLQHPAAPDRNVARRTDIVDTLGRREPADSARLYVDHLRCTDLDRLARVLAGVDRFVQADRSCDLALQGRVVDEVVVRERLLDHRRLRRVDPFEQRDVLEGVRRVCVEHEREIGEVLPRRLRDLDLEPWLDLQLHALVAALELAADCVHQRFDRWLDADRDTAEDPIACPAEERGERLVRALREEVPHRHLDRRLRHAVLADPCEFAIDVLGRCEVGLEELREDECLERVEDRSPRLARVPGALSRDALAPTHCALGLDATQHAGHVRLACATRLVRVLQW